MNIVIDLDETLVSVTETRRSNADFTFTLAGTTYYAIKRPGLEKFLKYVFKKFDSVNIWTAATRDYAKAILDNILTKGQQKKVRYFLCRRNLCSKGTKPLQKIFKEDPKLNASNTVMLDDNDYVTSNNKGNTFIIPKWKGVGKDDYLYKTIIIFDALFKYSGHLDLKSYTEAFYIHELTTL